MGKTDFRKLNERVIHRKANGKTIWQPRIECWLSDRQFRGETLPGKYAECRDWPELYEKMGVSNRLYQFNDCLEIRQDSSVRHSFQELDPLTTREVIETPAGTVSQILKRNTSNAGVYQSKWLVESEEDLKVMIYIEEATEYSFNQETFDRLDAAYGHLGLPAIFIPRTTMQRMFIDLAGVENSIYALMDYPDTLEAYFKVLNRKHAEICRLLAESPFQWVNYGDNIHSKLLPPDLFEKYVLPAYEERYDILHRQGGKFVYAHFDGDVRELMPYMQSCFLDGIEAITPRPQGDVTLKEVKKALGNDVFLIDGVAALLFQEDFPVELLKEQTEECLNLFEGQLVLGISDELSSLGTLERVELVRDMVEEFNAKR